MKFINKLSPTWLFSGIVVALFLSVMAIMSLTSGLVSGAISNDAPTVTPATFRTYEFFASSTVPTLIATTTSATSTSIVAFTDTEGRLDRGYFVIAGARKVQVYVNRTGNNGNAGSGTFKIQVTKLATSSADSAVWYDFSKMVQSTSTTAQQFIGVSGTTTAMFSLDNLIGGYYAMRCIVVEVTDGEHSCSAYAEF